MVHGTVMSWNGRAWISPRMRGISGCSESPNGPRADRLSSASLIGLTLERPERNRSGRFPAPKRAAALRRIRFAIGFDRASTCVQIVHERLAMSEASAAKPRSVPDVPRVALFVTCLVDLFRPTVGFAALKLLEDAGCRVEVPEGQTCCGQPAYNSGDRGDAKAFAKSVIAAFEAYDYVVAPSGSCAGMIKKHYPALLADEPVWQRRADALAARTFELVSFLTDMRGIEKVTARHEGSVTYHDSCSGLRELGIKAQPRRLLGSVEGLELKELPDADVCCGFGGTFCVKYPDVSNAIVEKKTAAITGTGAKTLLAGDLGCLLNMAGKLKREGSGVKSRHVAEVLAGMADAPAIGEAE